MIFDLWITLLSILVAPDHRVHSAGKCMNRGTFEHAVTCRWLNKETCRRAPGVYFTPACLGYIPPVCQLARRRVAGACTINSRAGVQQVCTPRRRVQVTPAIVSAGVLQCYASGWRCKRTACYGCVIHPAGVYFLWQANTVVIPECN